MKLTHKTVRTSLIILFVFFYALVLVKPSFTYPGYLKEARAQRYPALNCSYCHLSTDSGSGWNARGLWLIERRKEYRVAEVNVGWLKDYVPSDNKDTAGTSKAKAKDEPQTTKTNNQGTTKDKDKTKTP